MDANEPTEPIERTDPNDPIESTESEDAIESRERCERSDQRDDMGPSSLNAAVGNLDPWSFLPFAW
jgi:hypothetical protein